VCASRLDAGAKPPETDLLDRTLRVDQIEQQSRFSSRPMKITVATTATTTSPVATAAARSCAHRDE
jgi:hypothetical protein